ncbi:Polyketide cyclase / dehydrase and lipid transport [Aquimarina amphilecti]|uniref:Polyketide cyclase / dehydrase and lipid transport n=1 Tax=Aquimarina amphilecti TaxID=1038014 RepID=A0A1H7J7E9_AQUAM|nr:SRPBCC family protein [Aquimarina amphilecti]SEK70284.1 Polyketide cyclase / dehydrase and lipid transport [Aquimarina amphilecti]
MKITTRSMLALTVVFIINSTVSFAQSMSKKYRTIKVEVEINASADRVWEAMVLDYGEISNFSPYIYSSNYISGSLKGEQGAKRKCSFNEKGTRWTHERIEEIDMQNMIMRNIVIDAEKFPLDLDNSQAYYRVKDNGNGTSTASYEFQFRTKPAFIGAIAKGNFKNTLKGTLIGLKHYVETGEKVNAVNGKYKEIKKRYPNVKVVKG